MGYAVVGVRSSRVVTFAAIRLRGPGFKPRPGQKFETRLLLHSHPSGGEGVSPVQGEAIRRRYIKPEYLSEKSKGKNNCKGVAGDRHAKEERLYNYDSRCRHNNNNT